MQYFLYLQKPVILRVPQTEDVSSLSEIMKRAQYKQSTPEPLRDRSKTAYSELSRSMFDLSVHGTDHKERRPQVPRFRACVSMNVCCMSAT